MTPACACRVESFFIRHPFRNRLGERVAPGPETRYGTVSFGNAYVGAAPSYVRAGRKTDERKGGGDRKRTDFGPSRSGTRVWPLKSTEREAVSGKTEKARGGQEWHEDGWRGRRVANF